jgi:uncharacterized membrane protein HdeD (DUF308 family)
MVSGPGKFLLVFGLILARAYGLTQPSVLFLGWLMMMAGTVEAVLAFWKERGRNGFFVDLLSGILYFVVGFIVVANPAATTESLTKPISKDEENGESCGNRIRRHVQGGGSTAHSVETSARVLD